MANPTCTKATLSGSAAACYGVPANLSPKQAKALDLYAKVLELAAIGGTNYLTLLTSTLLSDAATMTCGMEQADRDAARLVIAFNNAAAAGATVPSTMAGKLDIAKCLVEATDKQLDEALVLLLCQLGRAKAYPQ